MPNARYGRDPTLDLRRRFGRLDILVNNAAGNFLVPAEDLKPKGFRTVIEIDTIGAACGVQRAAVVRQIYASLTPQRVLVSWSWPRQACTI